MLLWLAIHLRFVQHHYWHPSIRAVSYLKPNIYNTFRFLNSSPKLEQEKNLHGTQLLANYEQIITLQLLYFFLIVTWIQQLSMNAALYRLVSPPLLKCVLKATQQQKLSANWAEGSFSSQHKLHIAVFGSFVLWCDSYYTLEQPSKSFLSI